MNCLSSSCSLRSESWGWMTELLSMSSNLTLCWSRCSLWRSESVWELHLSKPSWLLSAGLEYDSLVYCLHSTNVTGCQIEAVQALTFFCPLIAEWNWGLSEGGGNSSHWYQVRLSRSLCAFVPNRCLGNGSLSCSGWRSLTDSKGEVMGRTEVAVSWR